MSRLLMVRHGDTLLNSAERLWGRTDVKLDALGLKQAERLSERLAEERIDVIYSSNLQRALVTAEIIAAKHQLKVITCAELREVDFGELEGLTINEVDQRYPEVTELRMKRNLEMKYPGGDSFLEFSQRVSEFLSRLEHHTIGETVLIVAHSGVLRVLLCRLLDMDLRHRWQLHVDLASLSILETNQRGTILKSLNDVCHLAQL